MSDLTHVDFLQQAYHDNWQQYLVCHVNFISYAFPDYTLHEHSITEP